MYCIYASRLQPYEEVFLLPRNSCRLLILQNTLGCCPGIRSFRKLASETNAYYIVHMTFGEYIRAHREALKSDDRRFSVRQVAQRIGVEPACLSKIERGNVAPPSEAKIRALVEEPGEDPDVLLAMAGKVSTDLQEIIHKRPELFADLIRQLKSAPDHALLRIVRDGDGNT